MVMAASVSVLSLGCGRVRCESFYGDTLADDPLVISLGCRSRRCAGKWVEREKAKAAPKDGLCWKL